jgi:hypothetical protein
MSVEATPFVKKYAPWSASKADTAQQCPLKFKHTYVNKMTKGRLGEEAQVGIVVHKILELCLSGYSLDAAKSEAMSDPKTKLLTLEREKVELAMPAVATFMKRTTNFIEKMGGAEILIERKVATTFNGRPLQFFDNSGLLRGVIDVAILFNKKPHIMIIDHKTGKNRGLEYYKWQFLSYTLLTKANYPQITHVIPAIHWVQDEYTDVGKPIEVDSVLPWIDQVIEHLNKTTKDAAENLDQGKPSKLCGWCDFKSRCPLAVHVTGDLDGQDEQGSGNC